MLAEKVRQSASHGSSKGLVTATVKRGVLSENLVIAPNVSYREGDRVCVSVRMATGHEVSGQQAMDERDVPS
jgi:hypothetical protein